MQGSTIAENLEPVTLPACCCLLAGNIEYLRAVICQQNSCNFLPFSSVNNLDSQHVFSAFSSLLCANTALGNPQRYTAIIFAQHRDKQQTTRRKQVCSISRSYTRLFPFRIMYLLYFPSLLIGLPYSDPKVVSCNQLHATNIRKCRHSQCPVTIQVLPRVHRRHPRLHLVALSVLQTTKSAASAFGMIPSCGSL